MRINVPFSYTATVIKKKHRNPETVYLWEYLEVELPELDDLEAPVATRWFDENPQFLTNYGSKVEWGPTPIGGIMETRWHSDSHWWPILLQDRGKPMEPSPKLTAEALVEICARGDNDRSPLNSEFYPKSNKDPVPLNEDDYREVQATSRSKVIEGIKERAADLIVVDGMIWRRGGEPVHYLKETFFSGTSIQLLVKVLPHDSHLIKSPISAYRADGFDMAAEASIIVDDGDTIDVNNQRKIDVFIPESIRYNGEEQAFLWSAKEAIKSYNGKMLKIVPDDVLEAFAPFRSAVTAASEDNSQIDQMAANFENFLMTIQFDDENTYAQGMRAIQRWNLRPISLDFTTIEPGVSF